MISKDLGIDYTWTLFLDRDGVINEKLENDYVKSWAEFKFIEGTVNALIKLRGIFGKLIVVTNQQGIGKGFYTHEDLKLIHQNMRGKLADHGVLLDGIYYSPFLAIEQHPSRKPGIGMALQACKEIPSILLNKSIIVGDSISDMEFGRNAGMKTVYISSEDGYKKSDLIDYQFKSLIDFADNI